MSWMTGAIGAAVGAKAGYRNAKEHNKYAKKVNEVAGKVDLTTKNDPWGPSSDHRTQLMDRARDLTDARSAAPAQPAMVQRPDGRWVKNTAPGAPAGGGGRARGGGGGGGGGGTTNEKPTNSRTNQLADALAGRANDGHVLYDPANNYVQDTLGGADRNAYRAEAAEKFGNLSDENLDRYMDMLFDEYESGSGARSAGSAKGIAAYSATAGPGGAAGTFQPNNYEPPVGAAEEIKAILAGKYLNEGNPYRDELIDAITKRTRQEFAEDVIPGINSEFAGASRFGSNAWQEAMAKGSGRLADSLGGTVAQVQSDDYNARMADVMGALGMGTSYDVAAMDDNTRRYLAAQDAAARSASASAGAGAAGADIASRERMALLSSLGGAVGLSAGLTQAGAAGLADIGADYSADQRFALGSVPDLTGLDVRDLSAAGGFSLDIDRAASEDRARRAAASNAAGGLGLQRQMFDFEKYRYGQDAPWNDLGRYGDIVAAMSGGYGSEQLTGTDFRSQPIVPRVDQQGQMLSGALAGWSAGSSMGGGMGGGGGGMGGF